MEENELTQDLRGKLTSLGFSAVSYFTSGAFLMVMTTIGARFKFVGIALSLAALIIGASALFSKEGEDKKPGLLIVVAGALGLVFHFGIPLLRPFAATILGFSSIGYLAAGICNGIRFLFGLKRLDE